MTVVVEIAEAARILEKRGQGKGEKHSKRCHLHYQLRALWISSSQCQLYSTKLMDLSFLVLSYSSAATGFIRVGNIKLDIQLMIFHE